MGKYELLVRELGRGYVAHPEGSQAAQLNEGVKVQVRLFVLSCALTINPHGRRVNRKSSAHMPASGRQVARLARAVSFFHFRHRSIGRTWGQG